MSIPTNVFINSLFNNSTKVYQSLLNIKMATYENNGFFYCQETNTWNEVENIYQWKIFIYVVKGIKVADV